MIDDDFKAIRERYSGASVPAGLVRDIRILLAEVERLRFYEMTSAAEAICELERLRPVYEAAVEWSESFGELSKRLPPHVHKLRDAVDAAEAKERKS